MNAQSILSGRFGRPVHCVGAVMLMALFATVPLCTIADQGAPTGTASSVAEVSLSELNLSSPDGMRLAGYRLHTGGALAQGDALAAARRTQTARATPLEAPALLAL